MTESIEMGQSVRGGMGLWWLSFADGDLPKGHQFLGVAIVKAHSFIEAVTAAHALSINPGGAVLGVPVPKDVAPLISVDKIERLLTRTEAEALDKWIIDKRIVGE